MKISASRATHNHGKSRQFLAAIILNMSTISFGIMCGWTSPVLPQLRSIHPPIGTIPSTKEQLSWLTSLPAIGGLVTIPFCGSLSEKIGRKNFAIVTSIPHLITWLLVIFGNDINYLYISRLICGTAVAMTIFIVPVYTSEIASEDIRGILGSLLLFSINIGILIAYVAGAFLSYLLFAWISLIFAVVYAIAIFFIPETPVYHSRRNHQEDARKSLMFYRGNNRELVERELLRLRAQSTDDDTKKVNVSFRDFFHDRAIRKGLLISMGLLAAQQLSGITAMTSYAETIFKHAGSSISSQIASIIVAVIQIIGSQASTMLMERAGRRLLSLISCIGMATSLGIVAMFFYLQRNNYNVSLISWLPLIALSGFIISYCLGIGPVPFVVISEVFDLNVTSMATTICFVFFFVIGFTGIRLFDFMMLIRGSDGAFFVLACISVSSFIFCYCLLPETKGRKREDIIDELGGICRFSREDKIDEDEGNSSKLIVNAETV